jgi:hypothetical protein
MTKRVSVDRLRDISKQRSIRRPLSMQPEIRLVDDEVEAKPEWPIGK